MKVLFCEDPLKPNQPDEAYQAEANVVKETGHEYGLINFEALVHEGNPDHSLKRITKEASMQSGIYRGWMLKPVQYKMMYEALLDKNIQLINSPSEYIHCHHLPQSYSIIENLTPQTVWRTQTDGLLDEEIFDLLRPFGSKPIIVKDYVKSQKHYWTEACFIPSASDHQAVKRVVSRFLELQADDLNEGLVFREFVDLEPLSIHSKSHMPLTQEFRVFVLDGEPLMTAEYWEEGAYHILKPQIEVFRDVMRQVKSRFFTMDIAKKKDGRWIIIELGDAQVAGLPERLDIRSFYRKLFALNQDI